MQITYFPYIHMDRQDELVFETLGLRVWNYGLKADDYIPDASTRAVLDSLMHSNIRYKYPITDMGIISIGAHDFREFIAEEKRLCQEVRLILFFGTLAYSGVMDRGPNTGHYMATSENFTIVEQNFQLDAKHTAVQEGYIVNMLHGGYKIDEVTFRVPDYVPNPMMFRRDVQLIGGLLRLRKRQKRLYRRIMRATEMLMQAYYNDTKLSVSARILTMASAYEILFDLPETRQRKTLRDTFEQLFDLPGDPRRTFVTHKDRRSGQYKRVNKSIKVYWANEFYELRSAIIHGSPLKDDAFIFKGAQRHFDIAVLFFVLGVKKYIEAVNCMPESYDQITWGKNGHPEFDGPDEEDEREEFEGFLYDKGDFRKITHDMLKRLSTK